MFSTLILRAILFRTIKTLFLLSGSFWSSQPFAWGLLWGVQMGCAPCPDSRKHAVAVTGHRTERDWLPRGGMVRVCKRSDTWAEFGEWRIVPQVYKGERTFIPASVNCSVQRHKDETMISLTDHIQKVFFNVYSIISAYSSLPFRDILQDRVVSAFKIVSRWPFRKSRWPCSMRNRPYWQAWEIQEGTWV